MRTTEAPGFAEFSAAPVMATIPPAARLALWQQAPVRKYQAGQTIRMQRDVADHLLVLLSGRAGATHLPAAGRPVPLGDYRAPCALDKVAVIDGAGHVATLTAIEACVVAAVPAAAFRRAIEELPTTRAHVLRALAAQARARQDSLVVTSLPGGRRRVAWWILRQAGGKAPAGGPPRAALPPVVQLPGSQSDLADALGLTRVTVNRALKALEREGAIRGVGGALHILDPERLANYLRD